MPLDAISSSDHTSIAWHIPVSSIQHSSPSTTTHIPSCAIVSNNHIPECPTLSQSFNRGQYKSRKFYFCTMLSKAPKKYPPVPAAWTPHSQIASKYETHSQLTAPHVRHAFEGSSHGCCVGWWLHHIIFACNHNVALVSPYPRWRLNNLSLVYDNKHSDSLRSRVCDWQERFTMSQVDDPKTRQT